MAETGSSAASASNTVGSSQETVTAVSDTRSSDDIGWLFGYLPNPADKDTIKCRKCGGVWKCTINRLKQHIAGVRGNIASCSKATDEDKKTCLEALDLLKKNKEDRSNARLQLRASVKIKDKVGNEVEPVEEIGMKRPRTKGPMDSFAYKSPEESIQGKGQMRQTVIKDAYAKVQKERVDQYVVRWLYQAGIPFNAITLDSFQTMLEAIGQYGPGYRGPSMYEASETLLKKEVEKTKEDLKSHRDAWSQTGCTIMTDGWTDRRHRSIMNLCVNCEMGTSFLRSVDSSSESHTATYIFELVDKCIEDVGVDNVIQVATDNAAANIAAGHLLKEKYPRIFWTSCAAHTMDLMLEDIAKKDRLKKAIAKARALTVFIYSHHQTLSMMRRCTKKREIVRPGVTRFATSFLSLQSLLERKEKLRLMFSSQEWIDLKYSSTTKGEEAASIVLSSEFWNNVKFAVQLFDPLVKVLRSVDSDQRPAMGWVFGELENAKKEIKSLFHDVQSRYKPYIDIIDEKAKGRLDSPLHLAGYYLNPFYFYGDGNMDKNSSIMSGIITCIETFYPDEDAQLQITTYEMKQYKDQLGLFGRKLAVKQRSSKENFNPAHWWSTYGSETPLLQSMALKILNLTCSSSGCERNWSCFEGIHTKKRNRLEVKKLNDLVYVQFNAKLKERQNKKRKDPLRAKEKTNARSWLVEGEADDEEEEVIPGSGFTWRMVAELSGANELQQPRRSTRASTGALASMSSLASTSTGIASNASVSESEDEGEEEDDDIEFEDDSDNDECD